MPFSVIAVVVVITIAVVNFPSHSVGDHRDTADLPACLYVTVFVRKSPAVWIYTHISKITDKDFPESTEIAMLTNANSLSAKSLVEH